jgi:hypothetical protein
MLFPLGEVPALPSNIRPSCKQLTQGHTLPYYDIELIMSVQSFTMETLLTMFKTVFLPNRRQYGCNPSQNIMEDP